MKAKTYLITIMSLLLFICDTISFGSELSQEVLTAIVTDQQGQPLPDVRITECETGREYTTDRNGQFTCNLSEEKRYFYAIDKHRKLAGSEGYNPGQYQMQIKLAPARVISGQVVDPDGRPVPGTQVGALPMTCWYVLSDNEGRFDVGWLPSWEPRNGLCLMARNVERNLAAVVDISRQAASIKIELIPALTLTGTVTNPKGMPFSEVRLALSLKKWTWGCGTPVRNTLTDDNGLFAFPALPQLQEYGLQIRAEDYLVETFTTGVISTIKEREEITPIVLRQKEHTINDKNEYSQLFINVVDEDRKPIDITTVQIWKKRDDGGASAKSFIVTSTNNSGLHKIENIPADRYHAISIHEEGYAPFKQFDVLVDKNSQNIITCTLSRGGTIEGLVTNEQGKLVEGMPVVVNSILCSRDVITDENGRFTVNHLPDTRYSIIAEPKSDSPYKITVFRGNVFCGQKDIKIILENKGETKRRTSLLGGKLPGFDDIKINLNPEQTQDKMMFVCFFDMEQRPSRNCILQLNKKAQELKAKDIVVIAIQTSKIEPENLDKWIRENNITFSMGMIETNEEKTRFNWGVKSLPWLILTDNQHIVQAEGFNINELDGKIKG